MARVYEKRNMYDLPYLSFDGKGGTEVGEIDLPADHELRVLDSGETVVVQHAWWGECRRVPTWGANGGLLIVNDQP